MLVPTSWQGPGGWQVTYDKDRAAGAVVGCNSWGITPRDVTTHQREWAAPDNTTGAGETSMVLGPADLPTAPPGEPAAAPPAAGQGMAPAAVAALDADEGSCTHKTVNGYSTVTLADPAVTMPAGGPQDAKVFCTKASHAGKPDSYACSAAVGKGDLFLLMYAFGPTPAVTGTGLAALLAAESPYYDAVE